MFILLAFLSFTSPSFAQDVLPPQPGPRSAEQAKMLIADAKKNHKINPKRAIKNLELFRERYPLDTHRSEADSLLADLYIETSQPESAARILNDLIRDETNLNTREYYRYRLAKSHFQTAALPTAKVECDQVIQNTKVDTSASARAQCFLLLSEVALKQKETSNARSNLDAALQDSTILNRTTTLSLQIRVGQEECDLNSPLTSYEDCLIQTKKYASQKILKSLWCVNSLEHENNKLNLDRQQKSKDSEEVRVFLERFKERIKQEGCPSL